MAHWNNILLCVDSSTNSDRAVEYLTQLGDVLSEATFCILHIYPEPPPNFLQKGGILNDYIRKREQRGINLINKARLRLIQRGFSEARISSVVSMAEGMTISQRVLEIRKQGGFGTVIVGKRGISKAEEFLFGSVSNALARQSKEFTVWIVG